MTPVPLPSAVARLIPPTPMSKRLATQSLLFATADGTFMTASAFYLYHFVGLSPAEVGLGLTIGAVAAFVFAYPMGRLADIVGPKRMWAFGGLAGSLMFGAWPFIHGFGVYVVVVVVFEAVNNAGGAGRNAYVLDVMPDKERVETQAYMYSSLNVGFTLGALIGGLALAVPYDAVLLWGVPAFSVLVGVLNAYWIWRLPKAPHDLRRESGERRVRPTGPNPFRNLGWLLSTFFLGTLWTNQVLLHTVIPLWLVAETDSPRWLLAWLFGTNTVMCILLPAYTSKGVHTVGDALVRVRWSVVFFVVACGITLVTHDTSGLLTIVLVWLGHVAVTGAELAISAATWAMEAELMDPERRGEYSGVSELMSIAGNGWAPALFTFLAMSWEPGLLPGTGWWVIAAVIVVAAAGLDPSARMADRFRERHFPKPIPQVADPVAEPGW